MLLLFRAEISSGDNNFSSSGNTSIFVILLLASGVLFQKQSLSFSPKPKACHSVATINANLQTLAKKANIYNTYHPNMTESECATKRIPVCPSTWESVHQLRMPGQTYDDVIRELIRTSSETKLIEETERICKRGHFVEYKL